MFRRTLSLLFLCQISHLACAKVELHVSPQGNDHAAGTLLEPLNTLSGARDRIRSLRTESPLTGPIEVVVHPGRYELKTTFTLNAEDSGTQQAPIVYRAAEGDVTITGGVVLQDWRPVQDVKVLAQLNPEIRDRVVEVNASASNASLDIHPRRLHEEMAPEHSELFLGNQRLPVARWPNEGWAKLKRVDARSWNNERTTSQVDGWALGFWENDWTAAFEPIAKAGSQWTLGLDDVKGNRALQENGRYKLCNILSELDQPGEWYLDISRERILYLPVSTVSNQVTLSILETVISIYDCKHLRFEGIRFEAGRAMVAEVVRGRDVSFENCQFANAGNVAVHLFNGNDHRLNRCEICTTGSSAIRIEAVDRERLTPSNHLIENCEIHDFAQHFMARRAGIALLGDGVKLVRNRIYDAPDIAIGIYGNDNLLEHNEVFHVCKETDDSGAIYLGYDPTHRGNQIRHNYIHDLGGYSKQGIIGIYLDDYASGTTVESNYLRNCIRGIAVGGGRDNQIINNVIQGGLAAIQIDARGSTWYRSHIHRHDSRIQTLCRSTLEAFPIYREKYPSLATMLEDEPELPKGNRIDSNLFDCPIGVDLQMPNPKIVEQWNNNRKPKSDFGSTSEVLAELGIQLKPTTYDNPTQSFYVSTE